MKKEFFFFLDAYLSTEKKPRANNLPFHYESSARKSNSLEQSGGGGGGGDSVNQLKLWGVGSTLAGICLR